MPGKYQNSEKNVIDNAEFPAALKFEHSAILIVSKKARKEYFNLKKDGVNHALDALQINSPDSGNIGFCAE